MMEPFLFRFAKQAGSTEQEKMDSDYYFDPQDDLLHSRKHPGQPPAIDLEGVEGPQTKKHDVEKSDDNKDDGIWM